MSIAENKAVVTRLIEIWNERDVAAIDEVLAPSFVWYGTGNLQRTKEVAAEMFAGPDHWTIEEMIAEGDKVAYRVTSRGTTGGVQFASWSIVIARIENGKIVDLRNEWSGTQRQA